MTVDPTDPEAREDKDDADTDGTEIDVEAPEADAAEQQADLTPQRDDSLTGADPDNADEADLVEQRKIVKLDEDDYR
ncbi:hypothetical protein QF026_003133 [Streptomyces aurantiacus]|uniref:hypothetical protein n=1 Tax=Streptomyces aurantiacus TaxID=47760 RepID=UPI00278EA34B|nr:hypothetical protein [Streptomyces aurantiacus]MDQ0774667.1 hypothetical protein [Streptomyces aurantiacus]